MADLLNLRKVYKNFSDNIVLKEISLELNNGEILGVIGPSGSGKTTLLRCIAQLEKQTEGTINLTGDVGVVFQDLHLWPHKTVLENITEALIHVKKMDKQEALEIAKDLLQQFDLLEKKNSFPDQLSVGQKQRVAIARALATKPKLLLLDEITSALDPHLVHELLQYMKKLSKLGISMIITSHNLHFIKQLSHKIIFLENGKIMEQGSPIQIFSQPKQKRTKAFVDKVRLVEG